MKTLAARRPDPAESTLPSAAVATPPFASSALFPPDFTRDFRRFYLVAATLLSKATPADLTAGTDAHLATLATSATPNHDTPPTTSSAPAQPAATAISKTVAQVERNLRARWQTLSRGAALALLPPNHSKNRCKPTPCVVTFLCQGRGRGLGMEMISRSVWWKRGATAALVCGGACLGLAAEKPPVADKKPVTDEYHGTKVVDDYQWLEKTEDPAVKAWVAGENKTTRDYIDALPDRKAIAARLTELYGKVSPRYYELESRPAGLFALKFQPPKQQPMLVVMPSADEPDKEKIVVDPNAMGEGGKTAIDWYVPSPDGKLVAVSLSLNGSEDGTLHFFRTENGEGLPDQIPRVQYPTGGGSAAWDGDGTVYYTRYPNPGERPEADVHFYQQVYSHRLGSKAEEDKYSIGKDFPRIAEIKLESLFNGEKEEGGLLATVANGDGGEFAHYVRLGGFDGFINYSAPVSTSQGSLLEPSKPVVLDPKALENAKADRWQQITRFEDKVKSVRGGRNRNLYLLSVQDAPHGKILSLTCKDGSAQPLKDAKVVVPEAQDAVIQGMELTAKHLFIADLVGGPSRIRKFDLDGGGGTELPLPPLSAVQQVVALEKTGKDDDGILFQQISYTAPYAWYSCDPTTGKEPVKTALAGTSPVDFGDIEAVREFATSKDGTKVPLNILRKKGTKFDGNNPTLLYAYGGYGISMTPNFVFTRRLWFDRGGVYVVANTRGGGEFGEEWHRNGNLTKKQNVFDDFAAAAEYLVKTGYTKPEKLAVEGGSNGGLLMGAFLTQHPDLARAVVTHVGIYDMLRVELDPNGAFNVTEFGTVKDPAQFKALYDYSPYHQVKDGTKYPATLFMTGDNDGRVNPLHSRKMTARLQAANGSDHPILLRTTANAGHGMGTALAERIEQEGDGDAFLFDQLGMK